MKIRETANNRARKINRLYEDWKQYSDQIQSQYGGYDSPPKGKKSSLQRKFNKLWAELLETVDGDYDQAVNLLQTISRIQE